MATLSLSVTVPDAQATDILNDFCSYHGYQATIPDPADPEATIPNPVTKAAYAKAKVASFVKESIKAWRANQAADTARITEITEVDALSIA